MLPSVRTGSEDRIRQTSLLMQQILRLESDADPAADEILKIQKGMLFVSMYASIEFTITSAASEFLAVLQAAPAAPRNYQAALLTVILNGEFNSVSDSATKRRWASKAALVEAIFSQTPCTIDNDVFPAEGTNISLEQLNSVWQHLRLPGDSLPTGVSPWVVGEIKEHRNAIAHGRERASVIGSRFSVATLESRCRNVEAICAHIVMSFEGHLQNKSYLVSA